MKDIRRVLAPNGEERHAATVDNVWCCNQPSGSAVPIMPVRREDAGDGPLRPICCAARGDGMAQP
jgi:hypothetical protein